MSLSRVEKCTICFMNVDGTNEYLRHIRQVHGNDRQFGTHCPLCDSKFVFTYLKSFIHHIRKHILCSPPDKEASSSLLPNRDEINININDENQQQQLLYEYEAHDPLEEIKKYSIVIEYNTITTTNSQAEAIAVLIGSYEIFNIEYPAKLRATLEVLNGLFKKRSFPLAAKRFFNEYKLNNRAL